MKYEKIVVDPLKIDLHIHSNFSKHKDNDKVKDSNIDNIEVLIEKLNTRKVNVISIIDHDMFNFDLYLKLKDEEEKENSIEKVFPGVEFSVNFNGESLHLITIFSDENISKIKK